jgi:hypothetical protein
MLIRKVFITLTPEGDSDDVLGTIPPSVDSQNYVAFQKALDTLYVSISGGDRIKVFDLIALKSGRFAARLTKEFFETIRPAFRAGKTHCVLAYDLDFDLSVPNLISIYSYLEKRKFENGKKANSDKFTLIKLRKVCPDLRNADILTITDEMLAESLIRALDYLQTIGISYTVAWRAHMKKGDKVASISMENFNKINIIFTWNFKTETKFSNRPKNVVSDRNSIEIKMKGNQNVQ